MEGTLNLDRTLWQITFADDLGCANNVANILRVLHSSLAFAAYDDLHMRMMAESLTRAELEEALRDLPVRGDFGVDENSRRRALQEGIVRLLWSQSTEKFNVCLRS